jgi:hypothetical protein
MTTVKKPKGREDCSIKLPLLYLRVFKLMPALKASCFLLDYLFAVVITALGTNPVRSFQFTALRAFNELRRIKLPNAGTPFIAPCL